MSFSYAKPKTRFTLDLEMIVKEIIKKYKSPAGIRADVTSKEVLRNEVK